MPYFSFELNPQQKAVFERLMVFAARETTARVFVLKGYAGTGKTTLVAGFLKYLTQREIRFELLASTGRAAKVLSEKTGHLASTIHRMVYDFEDINTDIEKFAQNQENNAGGKQLKLIFKPKKVPAKVDSKDRYCIYIVDEASMISDASGNSFSFARFGDGRLLKDLLDYDTLGKYLFIGDPCQLPPVGQQTSPALDAQYLEQTFDLHGQVWESELTKVMRQPDENGILKASLNLRSQIIHFRQPQPDPRIPVYDYDNIQVYQTLMDLFNLYMYTIEAFGDTYATIICHTNQQRLSINKAIRRQQQKSEPRPVRGDLLMVTQNHRPTGLVNGDFVRVVSVGKRIKQAGLAFLQIELSPLYNDTRHTVLLVEKVLNSKLNNLDQADQQHLLIDFSYRMKEDGIKQHSPAFRDAMMKDPYLNALRAVYGYAVTCHKGQGGEWKEVFLWMENFITHMNQPDIYRWWYTAMTRAVDCLHVAAAPFLGK